MGNCSPRTLLRTFMHYLCKLSIIHLLSPACLTGVLCHSLPCTQQHSQSTGTNTQKLCHTLGNLLALVCPFATPMLQTSLLVPTLIQATFFTNLMLTGLCFGVCFSFFFFRKSTHTCLHLQRLNTSTPLKGQPWRQTGMSVLSTICKTHTWETVSCFIPVCVELLLQDKIRALRISSPDTSLLGQMPNKSRPFHLWSCFPQTSHTKWFVSLSAYAGFPSKPKAIDTFLGISAIQ